jgi:hypothetical protein
VAKASIPVSIVAKSRSTVVRVVTISIQPFPRSNRTKFA